MKKVIMVLVSGIMLSHGINAKESGLPFGRRATTDIKEAESLTGLDTGYVATVENQTGQEIAGAIVLDTVKGKRKKTFQLGNNDKVTFRSQRAIDFDPSQLNRAEKKIEKGKDPANVGTGATVGGVLGSTAGASAAAGLGTFGVVGGSMGVAAGGGVAVVAAPAVIAAGVVAAPAIVVAAGMYGPNCYESIRVTTLSDNKEYFHRFAIGCKNLKVTLTRDASGGVDFNIAQNSIVSDGISDMKKEKSNALKAAETAKEKKDIKKDFRQDKKDFKKSVRSQ